MQRKLIWGEGEMVPLIYVADVPPLTEETQDMHITAYIKCTSKGRRRLEDKLDNLGRRDDIRNVKATAASFIEPDQDETWYMRVEFDKVTQRSAHETQVWFDSLISGWLAGNSYVLELPLPY